MFFRLHRGAYGSSFTVLSMHIILLFKSCDTNTESVLCQRQNKTVRAVMCLFPPLISSAAKYIYAFTYTHIHFILNCTLQPTESHSRLSTYKCEGETSVKKSIPHTVLKYIHYVATCAHAVYSDSILSPPRLNSAPPAA